MSAVFCFMWQTRNPDCTFTLDPYSPKSARTEYTQPKHGKRFSLYFLYREGARSLCELLTGCSRRVSAKITTGLESTKLK